MTNQSLLFFSFLLWMGLSYQTQAQDIQVMLPTQYDGKAVSKKLEFIQDFYIYKAPVHPQINLSGFKQLQPDLILPDTLNIDLPEMTDVIDTTLLIGFVQDKITSSGYLVLLLATNYTTNEVTFYIDSNFNGNYKDDQPITVLAGKRSVNFELRPPNGGAINLTLRVPKRLNTEEQNKELLKQLERKSKKKIYNKLSAGIYAGLGIGQLNYDYTNTDLNFPTWYEVRFTERAMGINLNYETIKFRVGVNATLINHYYYTSYLNVQFAEPRGIKSGILTERNIDTHSLNRFQIGGTVAYKIQMSQFSDIQPFVTVGQLFYLSDSYFSDNRPNKEVAYALSADYFYELGVRLDFTIGNEKSIFIDLASNTLKWWPDNFLEGINLTNLGIKHHTWKINFGYRIGL